MFQKLYKPQNNFRIVHINQIYANNEITAQLGTSCIQKCAARRHILSRTNHQHWARQTLQEEQDLVVPFIQWEKSRRALNTLMGSQNVSNIYHVCVCVYIYIYTHICVYNVYVYIYIYMYYNTYVYIILLYIYVYISILLYVYIYIWLYIWLYIYDYIYIYVII